MCLLNLWSSIFLFLKVLIMRQMCTCTICILSSVLGIQLRTRLTLAIRCRAWFFFLHHSLSPLLLGTIIFGMLKPLNIVHISIRFYLFYLNLFLSLFFTLLISINPSSNIVFSCHLQWAVTVYYSYCMFKLLLFSFYSSAEILHHFIHYTYIFLYVIKILTIAAFKSFSANCNIWVIARAIYIYCIFSWLWVTFFYFFIWTVFIYWILWIIHYTN